MPHLLDSNLLIYPFDDNETFKRAKAKQVLRVLTVEQTAFLSTQTLSEFSNVMLRKLKIEASQVYTLTNEYEAFYSVLPVTTTVILEAIRGVNDYNFAFYDAQIWAVAKLNQIPSVLSEDFATGSSIEGVTFQNPLAQDFDLTLLEA